MANLTCIIIGAGYMGTKHIQSYQVCSQVKVIGIVDADNERLTTLQNIYGIAGFNSIEKAVEVLHPDIVDVCLPSNLHKHSVLVALEHGCHVIVEKPFAVSLEDIDEMIEAASRAKGRLMVAHVCRFMSQYRYLKDIIEKKDLGSPLLYTCWRLSEAPMWSWNNWLHNDKESGGTLMDLSIHDIDISNWLFGIPSIQKSNILKKNSGYGNSYTMSKLNYPDGIISAIEASHIMPKNYPFSTGYRMVCENGVIEYNTVNCKNQTVAKISNESIAHIDVSKQYPMLENDPYTEELFHFIKCISDDSPFVITLDEAQLAVKTVWDLFKTTS